MDLMANVRMNLLFGSIVALLAATALVSAYLNAGRPAVQLPEGHPPLDTATRLQALEQMSRQNPDNADYKIQIGNAYYDLGQYQKAIASAKRGLEGNPDQSTALLYYQYGAALSKLESFDESIAMFEKVVATKDPQWVDSAKKQIDRQVRLKKIAEQKKQQG